MSNKQPKKYTTKLPRVSSIVEYFYPFTGEPLSRFVSWLNWYDIPIKEYMDEASSGGTYVHKIMEKYGLTHKVGRIKGEYKGFVEGGIKAFADYNIQVVESEKYIRTKDYQGTIDLVCNMEYKGTNVTAIIDWKTFGLAKHKFGIPIGEYRKPYSKLKKARLQLSLYARAIGGVDELFIVELPGDGGYHLHRIDKICDDELDSYIEQYKLSFLFNGEEETED